MEKRGLRGNLKGGCSEDSVGLFSQGTSDRIWGNSLKLHWGRLKLDIRKNFSWRGWSGTGMGCLERQWSPYPWEVFERRGDVALRDMA